MFGFECDALSLKVLLQLGRDVTSGRLKLLLELSQTEKNVKKKNCSLNFWPEFQMHINYFNKPVALL